MRLIDADALVKQIDNPQTEYPIMIQIRRALKEFINSAPTVKSKCGEWTNRNPYWHTAICSNCNKVTMFEEWDGEVWEYYFCPNCGADMRGKGDNQ